MLIYRSRNVWNVETRTWGSKPGWNLRAVSRPVIGQLSLIRHSHWLSPKPEIPSTRLQNSDARNVAIRDTLPSSVEIL